MEDSFGNKTSLVILAGLVGLLVALLAFGLVGDFVGSAGYIVVTIAIAVSILIIGAIYIWLMIKGKAGSTEPDFRTMFIMGLVFLVFGLNGTSAFLVIGVLFMLIGWLNRKNWKAVPKWSEMPWWQRNLKIGLVIILGLMVLATLSLSYVGEKKSKPSASNNTSVVLTEAEALGVARDSKECSAAGVLSDNVFYNENSKTWWIGLDRMPEVAKDGCNPACVVWGETRTAEVNWRCTGLIPPDGEAD